MGLQVDEFRSTERLHRHGDERGMSELRGRRFKSVFSALRCWRCWQQPPYGAATNRTSLLVQAGGRTETDIFYSQAEGEQLTHLSYRWWRDHRRTRPWWWHQIDPRGSEKRTAAASVPPRQEDLVHQTPPTEPVSTKDNKPHDKRRVQNMFNKRPLAPCRCSLMSLNWLHEPTWAALGCWLQTGAPTWNLNSSLRFFTHTHKKNSCWISFFLWCYSLSCCFSTKRGSFNSRAPNLKKLSENENLKSPNTPPRLSGGRTWWLPSSGCARETPGAPRCWASADGEARWCHFPTCTPRTAGGSPAFLIPNQLIRLSVQHPVSVSPAGFTKQK